MKTTNFVRAFMLATSLWLQLSLICVESRGAAGDLDLSFDPGSSVDGAVNAIALQPDGKVIIAGEFTTVRGLIRTNLARLNADGSGDSSFNFANAAFYNPVHVMARQTDGKLLVGMEGGGMLRLNSDGSQDYDFTPSLSFWWDENQYEAWVLSIALQSDGKIVIGGWFALESGGPGIARLNPDGSLDAGFNPSYGYAGGVECIALQPDGKLLARGYGGLSRYLTNGNLDNTFVAAGVGRGLLLAQPDGKVLVGTTTVSRLNTNGSLDGGFNVAMTNGSSEAWVRAMIVQPDGKILVAGAFDAVNGTNRNGLARLNPNGSLDSGFKPGTGPDGSVSAIGLQPDGNVLLAGNFLMVNGVLRPHLARLFGDSPWPSLKIARSNASVNISWPVNALSYSLQETTNLSLANARSVIMQAAVTNAGQISVTAPIGGQPKFFRLQAQ